MTFEEASNDWCARNGLNLAALALELGVSGASVSRYRTGEAIPRPALLRRMGRVLGLDPAELGRACRAAAAARKAGEAQAAP
jgi:transcriptional regulator with XRE-family HTH domain